MTDTLQNSGNIEGAEQTKISLEMYINLDIAQFARGGDLMRVHDFARVDIPVMIAAASGKLGTPEMPVFDLKDYRQNALLDLEPMALQKRLDENFNSARKALAWASPHLAPETRKFIKLGDEGTFKQLSKILIEQRQAVHDRENTIFMGYEVNGKKVSVDAIPETNRVADQIAVKKDDQFLTLKNGDRVRMDVKIHNFTDERFRSWHTKYAVSNNAGDRSIVTENDVDRGFSAYGIVMEREDHTYFIPISPDVQLGRTVSVPDGEVREIVGLSSGKRKFFENNIDIKNLPPNYDATAMMRLSTMRPNDGSKPHCFGEIHYSSTMGPMHQSGPIVLQAMPWSVDVDEAEFQIAHRMIDAHIARTEHSQVRIAPGVSNDNREIAKEPLDPKIAAMHMAAAQMAQSNGR